MSGFNRNAALILGLVSCALRFRYRDESVLIPEVQPISTEPSASDLDYSVIIPVYNRPDIICRLLDIIRLQSQDWKGLGAGEIVVVDDGSVDDTAKKVGLALKTMPIPGRVISIPHSGPGAARNAGFAAARGRIGVAIDSDCEPRTDWLPGLIREATAAPKTAAFARVCSDERVAYPIENVPDKKGFVSASFAIDREVFCEIGGFYSKYGMSHEDLDFVEVLRQKRYNVVRAQSHIEHPMRSESLNSIWRVGRNSKYANLFVRRHGRHVAGITRTTPYYFFGILGNYGSSLAHLVFVSNLAAVVIYTISDRTFRENDLGDICRSIAGLSSIYVFALALLGWRVGAGFKRLPRYVATLAVFQIATLVGRLDGSIEYGALLL